MAEAFCPSCGSCGFPMRTPDDYAGGLVGAAYCSTCGNDEGALRPWDEVLQANAAYLVREQGLDPRAARELARAMLTDMPAWKGQS
jgi:Putative zinc ribbon domain